MDSGRDISTERYYHGIDIIALFFRVLRRTPWIVLAILIGAAAARYNATHRVTPLYQATTKLYIAGTDSVLSSADLELGSTLKTDYLEAFKIWHVHETVAERLGEEYSENKLSRMINASVPKGSHILYITATSSKPAEAQLVADTYAEAVQEYIAESMELRKPNIIEKARKPVSPVSPNVKTSTRNGAVTGGLLAGIVFVLIGVIDDRVRSEAEITAAVGLPVFGVIPRQREGKERYAEAAAADSPEKRQAVIRADLTLDSRGAEAVNLICSALTFSRKNLRRLTITSTGPNEGKTFTALQLAVGMSRRTKKVLLIDADLRNSVMRSRYRIEMPGKGFGLAHLLSGQCGPEKTVYATNVPNLFLIPAGANVKNSLSLLTAPEFGNLLEEMAEMFDLILIDTPPLGAVVDAAEVARCCDGSMVVVEQNRTRSHALKEAVRLLNRSGVPILGCILNKARISRLRGAYGAYSPDGEKKDAIRRRLREIGEKLWRKNNGSRF